MSPNRRSTSTSIRNFIIAVLVILGIILVSTGFKVPAAALWIGIYLIVSIVVLLMTAALVIVRIIVRSSDERVGIAARWTDLLLFVLPVIGFLIQYGSLYEWIGARYDGFSQSVFNVDAIYLTMGVLSTAGSDITPQTASAELAVALQEVADILIVAIGLSIAVAYVTGVSRRGPSRKQQP
jgi:hypothetical protein